MTGRCNRACAAVTAGIILVAGGVTLPAYGVLTYTVEPVGGWPSQGHYDAAVAAIQSTVSRYNAYSPNGFGNYTVHVEYQAGVPTAEAGYLWMIRFGGTFPNERVMMHEMAHYLGSGTYGTPWDGFYGEALIDQFDGIEATLNGDNDHFWPYGLNYDDEGSEINKQRQVAMVYAQRADMGIGPSSHPSTATTVVATASDPVGQSGFNYKTRWSDGYFAHAGADYFTGDYAVRTPVSQNSFTFAGDSLTIDNTNGASGGLFYEGLGTGGAIAFDDLRLDGGWIQHSAGVNNLFQLNGDLNVLSDSVIRAKEGNIDILADVAGSSRLTIETTDSPAQDNRYVRFLSSDNSFSGDLDNQARFELADGGNFRFVIGPSGASNAIAGATALATRINGVFELDLTGATSNPGDSWALVTAANTTYGATFDIPGFNNSGGEWSNGSYTFSQATGLLTLVTAWAVDGGGMWSDDGNWTGGVPTAGGDATLGSALTRPNSPATVNLDVPVTLNRLTFDNPNRYVVAGANPLTLNGGAQLLVRNGSHEVAVPVAGTAGLAVSGGGTIRLSAANPYTGDTNIESGTLALVGTATIANSANIYVHPGATFDVSGLSSTFAVAGGQTLHNNSETTVVGDVVATGGSLVTGSGTFNNDLALQSGSTLRIGGAGLPISVAPVLIDNFDSYNNSVNQNIGAHSNGDVTGGRWDGVFDGTNNAQIVDDADPSDNSIRVYGLNAQNDPWRGAVTNLANNFSSDHSLADGDMATYFFQFRRDGSGDIDGIFGLADGPAAIDTVDPWNDYAVLASIFGPNPSNTDLRAYSEGSGDVVVVDNISHETWYNVWLVVDNLNKTYDIYTSTGTEDANPSDPSTYRTGLNFGRDLSVASLEQFGLNERLSNSNPNDGALRIDNIYVTPGENTANPLAPGGGIVYSPEVLRVLGDVSLEAGSTVTFDIATSGGNDLLDITGNLTAGGTLEVHLDGSAPALSLGDSFDLLDFGSVTGKFTNYALPALDVGLTWNTSRLTIDGVLSVAAAIGGDYNGNGVVDAADYAVWRDRLGQLVTLPGENPDALTPGEVDQEDYDFWVVQFGATLGGGSSALGADGDSHSQVAVPEPATTLAIVVGALVGSILGGRWPRRHRAARN